MTASIKTRYKRLLKKEDSIADAIKSLQEECNHPDRVKKYYSSTGNYDPTADCYWIEYKCPDCGKFWIEINER